MMREGGSASLKTMGACSPQAQILGGKAAVFANALRTTRSTFAIGEPATFSLLTRRLYSVRFVVIASPVVPSRRDRR